MAMPCKAEQAVEEVEAGGAGKAGEAGEAWWRIGVRAWGHVLAVLVLAVLLPLALVRLRGNGRGRRTEGNHPWKGGQRGARERPRTTRGVR